MSSYYVSYSYGPKSPLPAFPDAATREEIDEIVRKHPVTGIAASLMDLTSEPTTWQDAVALADQIRDLHGYSEDTQVIVLAWTLLLYEPVAGGAE